MHSLIDKATVESIRTTGKTSRDLPDRIPILEKFGFVYDKPAENVVISGCQIMPSMPDLLAPLVRLFEQKGLSYSFLSREYCCGNYLYRPAIKAKDESAMEECRMLSKEFVGKNLEQAKELGAKRIIIFCSPCYPIYRHAYGDEPIVFYPEAIDELVEPMDLDGSIDYYPGCYRLHKKFSPAPMDLASTNRILKKFKGLEVNRIGAPKCCYHPEGLEHMIKSVSTKIMLHICTGCYAQAVGHMPSENSVNVMMLPEFVEKAMAGQKFSD
jgi:hypothetical protein